MKKESLSLVAVKTLLAVLLFAGIGTIIIGGGYIIGEYSKNGTEKKIVKPVNQETKSCVEEGEKFYLKPGEPQEKECCDNLKTGTVYSIIENECIPETIASVCIDCPNNECGIGEDKCNCPEDCEEKTTEVEIYFNNMEKYKKMFAEMGGEELYKVYNIDDCNPIFSVKRSISKTDDKIEFSRLLLEELKKGPNEEEVAQGFTNDETFLRIIENFEIKGDSLLINFNKQKLKDWEKTISPRILESLASCEWGIYFSFINKTFGQIPEINTVQIPANIFTENNKIDDWQTYRNEEFGFEIKFNEDYKDLWEAEMIRADDNEDILAVIHFSFKNHSDSMFSSIRIYRKEWFNNNSIIKENYDEDVQKIVKIAWKGEEKNLPNYVGLYLGENDNYVFTYGIGPHACPAPEPLCSISQSAKKMILNSFSAL